MVKKRSRLLGLTAAALLGLVAVGETTHTTRLGELAFGIKPVTIHKPYDITNNPPEIEKLLKAQPSIRDIKGCDLGTAKLEAKIVPFSSGSGVFQATFDDTFYRSMFDQVKDELVPLGVNPNLEFRPIWSGMERGTPGVMNVGTHFFNEYKLVLEPRDPNMYPDGLKPHINAGIPLTDAGRTVECDDGTRIAYMARIEGRQKVESLATIYCEPLHAKMGVIHKGLKEAYPDGKKEDLKSATVILDEALTHAGFLYWLDRNCETAGIADTPSNARLLADDFIKQTKEKHPYLGVPAMLRERERQGVSMVEMIKDGMKNPAPYWEIVRDAPEAKMYSQWLTTPIITKKAIAKD